MDGYGLTDLWNGQQELNQNAPQLFPREEHFDEGRASNLHVLHIQILQEVPAVSHLVALLAQSRLQFDVRLVLGEHSYVILEQSEEDPNRLEADDQQLQWGVMWQLLPAEVTRKGGNPLGVVADELIEAGVELPLDKRLVVEYLLQHQAHYGEVGVGGLRAEL